MQSWNSEILGEQVISLSNLPKLHNYINCTSKIKDVLYILIAI